MHGRNSTIYKVPSLFQLKVYRLVTKEIIREDISHSNHISNDLKERKNKNKEKEKIINNIKNITLYKQSINRS